ncbi:MAG TPA: hypothetical protein PKE64_10240 [Anaerolineae bacterium]|nr:hypothetical protein [Anaerolineae bacterium]HMR64378.1 hypothetical protein [Anaerolineae bacterium]
MQISGRINVDEIVGWSWLIPPHRWRFSALVIQPTEAICLDGLRLRQACETDHKFGYQLLKRLTLVLGQRREETRRRLEI